MAQQMGIFPLKGTIDNISFYKTKDGFQARKKSGVSRERLLNDPKFARAREHMTEFTTAVRAAKLIRTALLKAVIGSTDGKLANRLIGKLIGILRKDAANPRGTRTPANPAITELTGFDFNANGPLRNTLKLQYEAGIDADTGVCKVVLPPYLPEEVILVNNDATHYRFRIAAAAVNMATESYEAQTAVTGYQPLKPGSETGGHELMVTLSQAGTDPVLLALTMEYVQEVTGGERYPLKSGALNPCAIVAVHFPG